MDNEIIKRVTKAAYENFMSGLIGCCEPSWKQLPIPHKERLIAAQLAAIKAMREPTEKMKVAGSIDPGSGGPDNGYKTEVWQSMIDVIIGDE